MILDLLCIVLFVAALFIGKKSGLLYSVLSIGIFALAVILTILFAEPVSAWMIEQPFTQNLIQNLAESLKLNPEAVLLPPSLVSSLSETLVETAEIIITRAVTALILILLFFVIKFILKFTKPLFKKITKLPIIRQVDGLLGLLTGGFLSLLIIMLVFTFLGIFSGSSFALWIQAQLQESHIAIHLYNHNIFHSIF